MTEVFGEDLLGEVDLFVDLCGSCPFLPGEGTEVLAFVCRAPANFHRAWLLLQAIHIGSHKGATGRLGILL